MTSTTSNDILHMSILFDDRRLDVTAPAFVPLVEVVPTFARSLGALDPSLVHGGYSLHRVDGSSLDLAKAPSVQGVHDGDLLTLSRGDVLKAPRVYDDVVEAVIDSTQSSRPWTAKDNSRTAIAAGLTLLGICAVLLLLMGRDSITAPIMAGGAAVVLVVVAASLGRLAHDDGAISYGMAAAAFAGLAGYLAVQGYLWGWPMAACGGGLAVAGAAVFTILSDHPRILLTPVILGVCVGVSGIVSAAGSEPVTVYAMMVAAAAVGSNLSPWIAMSSTRLRVISPQSDAEIFAQPDPIDGDDVRHRARDGGSFAVSLRLGFGLAVLLATPLVAAANTSGAVLCLVAFIGMMFQARQRYARAEVMALMVLGAVGIAVTGITVAASQPGLRQVLLIVLSVATAVLVSVTMLSDKVRPALGRIADGLDVICLAVLIPLGVLAAGLA